MKKLNPVSIGLAIRTIREQQMMSGSDVARRVGLSASAMSRIENGLRSVDIENAVAIAAVLGKPVQFIVDAATQLEESGVVAEQIAAVEKLKQTLDGAREAAQSVIDDLIKG